MPRGMRQPVMGDEQRSVDEQNCHCQCERRGPSVSIQTTEFSMFDSGRTTSRFERFEQDVSCGTELDERSDERYIVSPFQRVEWDCRHCTSLIFTQLHCVAVVCLWSCDDLFEDTPFERCAHHRSFISSCSCWDVWRREESRPVRAICGPILYAGLHAAEHVWSDSSFCERLDCSEHPDQHWLLVS